MEGLSLVVWCLVLEIMRAEEYHYFLEYKNEIKEVGQRMGSGLVSLQVKGALAGTLFANSRS